MTRDVYLECMKLINEIGGISETMKTKHPDLSNDSDSIDDCLNQLYGLIFDEVDL